MRNRLVSDKIMETKKNAVLLTDYIEKGFKLEQYLGSKVEFRDHASTCTFFRPMPIPLFCNITLTSTDKPTDEFK